MDHEHRLTIHVGLTADTIALVRELFKPADASKLTAALSGFEQKTSDLQNSIAENTPKT